MLKIRNMDEKERITPYPLRMDAELRTKTEDAARAVGRSTHAEIIHRLQSSFNAPQQLPFSVQEAVTHAMEQHGGTFEEALEKLVLAGHSQGGQVLNLKIGPGTTTQQVRDALSVAMEFAPNADLVLDRTSKP